MNGRLNNSRPGYDTKMMVNSSNSQQRPLLLLSSRPWNTTLAERLYKRLERPVHVIDAPANCKPENVAAIDPQWIFVPHWSSLIPQSIWGSWPTVVFHMTDLPYGRGGSPLQNLIKRGHHATMLTALRCCDELDSGEIYLKEHMSLAGSAEEIYLRANEIIEKMIVSIVCKENLPIPQKGKPVIFKRRTPEQSNLCNCSEGELSEWYDHIRMLDAEGYPHAFLKAHGMQLEFRRVSRRSDGLHADVKITAIKATQRNSEEPNS